MDVMIGSTDKDQPETICIPPSVLDPKGKKMGQRVSCKVSGIIKSIGEHGTTIELGDGEEDEEDLDDFENDEPEEQERKIKKQFGKNKLEEYD
jgi:hypothetical protein